MWNNVPELVDITLLEQLGEGANGVVYIALSNSLGLVAAKTLHILLHPDKFYVEPEGEVCLMEEDHFRQEVETLMKFSHPNIIQCFGVWFKSEATRKIPHMIFELGECAFDAFLYSNKLSQSQAIKFGIQIVKGIQYLHMQHSTAHRDIKPGNMVLFNPRDRSQERQSAEREVEQQRRTEQQKIEAEKRAKEEHEEAVLHLQAAIAREAHARAAWESAKQEAIQAKQETKASENRLQKVKTEANHHTVKLIDFGESKYASRNVMKTKVGTPVYLDQKVSTEHYDKSVDVYSFGCVLIQMICGYEALCSWKFAKEKQERFLAADMVSKLGEELSEVVRCCIREENRIELDALLETLEAITPFTSSSDCCNVREAVGFIPSKHHEFALALKVYFGDGEGKDEKNLKKTVEWLTAAANQGHSIAQHNLGVCYHQGEGVEKSFEKAVEWYTAAVNQGLCRAQNNLGYCYHQGEGVEKSLEKAVEWYTAAAIQGDSGAQNNLGVCYKNGEGVERNFEKAVEWYTAAANQGHSSAQFNLGICYKNGEGVEKNFEKAVEWYTAAANQGHSSAQFNLGICYKKGEGVEKNFEKAVEWYTAAANQGHSRAQYTLGVCYEKGEGVEKSLEKAVEWYTAAAKQGHSVATKRLELNEKQCCLM